MGKPGVMFYFEIRPCLEELSDREQAELFRAILDYGQFGRVPELSRQLRLIWGFIRQRLDGDNDRYNLSVMQSRYANYVKEARKRQMPVLTFGQWQEANSLREPDGAFVVDALPIRSGCFVEEAVDPEPEEDEMYRMEPDGTGRNRMDISGTQLQLQNQKQIQNQNQTQTQTQTPGVLGPAATRPSFSPPSREAVLDYCQENGLLMDVDEFLDYYTANGWRIGKSPMKSWQAAVRRWCRKEASSGKAVPTHTWNIGTTV